MREMMVLLVSVLLLCGCVSQETTTTTSSTAVVTSSSSTSSSTSSRATTSTKTTTTATTSSTTTTLPGTVVRISEFMFIPNPVVISRGGTVTWVNEDSARHSIMGVGFRSEDLLKGGTYSRTYEQAGNFPYHCGIHPLMKGEVRVK